MIDLRHDQKVFVEECYKYFNKDILTRKVRLTLFLKEWTKNPSWLKTEKYKVERGTYKLPLFQKTENEKIMDTGESKKTEAAYVVSSLNR